MYSSTDIMKKTKELTYLHQIYTQVQDAVGSQVGECLDHMKCTRCKLLSNGWSVVSFRSVVFPTATREEADCTRNKHSETGTQALTHDSVCVAGYEYRASMSCIVWYVRVRCIIFHQPNPTQTATAGVNNLQGFLLDKSLVGTIQHNILSARYYPYSYGTR